MKGYVNVYSPNAKSTIRKILTEYLEEAKAEKYTDNILTILDELVKNGLKGNYKYLFILEKIGKYLVDHHEKDLPTLAQILRSAALYHEFVEKFIARGSFDTQLREVLDQEAKIISIKTKANEEKRKLTREEENFCKTFSQLNRVRKKARIYKVTMNISMHYEKKILLIEVANSAPILANDMAKIKDRRAKFKEYADKGQEAKFFVENVAKATSGAGLGYGTIDASLLDMGLNPEESLTIISTSNTTIILSIEFGKLK